MLLNFIRLKLIFIKIIILMIEFMLILFDKKKVFFVNIILISWGILLRYEVILNKKVF